MIGIKAESQGKDRREGWRYLKGAASIYQLLFHMCAVFFGNCSVHRAIAEAEEDGLQVTLI